MRLQIQPTTAASAIGNVVCNYIDVPHFGSINVTMTLYDQHDSSEGITSASCNFPWEIIDEATQIRVRDEAILRCLNAVAVPNPEPDTEQE